MKVAILSESSADEAAVKILIDGLLQTETELTPYRVALRSGGWSSVIKNLPRIISAVYYYMDADAIAVVLDSDDTAIHKPEHGERVEPQCRLCEIVQIFKDEQIRPMPGRAMLDAAMGLAVPAIEAWLLCGVNPRVGEASWERWLLNRGKRDYDRKSLKRELYGTERPSIGMETEKMTEAATRLVSEENFPENLTQIFPNGFGYFVEGARSWQDS